MGDDENACVRNIVKEIMRECKPKKINVNKNFVTYVTKLLLMDPNWGIGDDFFNQRHNVQLFVRHIIDELLTKQDDPKLITMKIHFYFSCNLEHMDYAIESNRRELKHKLASIKDVICATVKLDTKEEIERLFRNVVYYITLLVGLGNPAKPKVYEEALVALKSILDEDELKEFAELPKNEKRLQLEQLANIVAGIRLFNKDCDRGGEGIADLPELLDLAFEVIRRGTEQTLLWIMERVNSLTTLVDKCYIIKKTYKGYQLKLELPEEVTKPGFDIRYLEDLLIFFRQYELLIRKILEELDRTQEKSEHVIMAMEKLLKTIHETVYMKIAIPVGVVFPLFEELWGIWQEFQNQAILMARLSLIMSNLEAYAKETHFAHVMIDHLFCDSSSMTDAERLARNAHLKLETNHPDISVIRSESIKNIDNIELEYLGFCCWKLIETDGALIPGNPSMGIVIYKGKNYVFSCVEGFEEFAKDPQMYVNYVLFLARRKPQLINFFQLRDELESVYNIEKLVQSKVEIRMCEEKSAQCMSNMEEPHIDPTYKWNIWDLKREALTMANISTATTRSVQTDKSGSSNSIRTQTYFTKKVEVQTNKDNYTNVPKPSVFIYGLRGRKDDQQFKIDLTRPVEEG